MTVVTIRPDSTPFSNGSLTGAATVHAALSDDSDSSYFRIGSAPGFWTCGFANPTFPAGSLLASIALRVRCSIDNTPKQYTVQLNGVSGPWGAPPVSSTLTVSWMTPTTVTIAPAELAGLATPVADVNLDSVQASVARVGSGLDVYLKSYEAYLDLTVVEQPEVAATAPTGTLTTTNAPLTSWTRTLDSDGGGQSRYEVKIFSAAQYGAGGFDPATSTPTTASGVQAGADLSWQMGTALADGLYRAYVRVGQTVNGTAHWSDWDFEAFEIDVAVPDAPLVVVTALDEYGALMIDMAENGGAATTDAFELQRSLDGGLTWEPVRLPASTEGGILPGDEATLYDFEAPNSTQVLYRARALHDYGGTYGASPWTTEPGEWSSGDWWLKCPASPALNRVVNVHSQTGVQRRPRRGTFQPVGARYPVVVRTTRSSDEGPIVFRTDDDQAIDELLALADSGRTLLLQAPPTDHWPDRYVELGDADMSRFADKAFVAEHLHAYQWTEVATPDDPVDEWPEFGS